MASRLVLLVSTVLVLVGCGVATPGGSAPEERWESGQGPEGFYPQGVETRLASLPSSGSMARETWGFSYWPDIEGGAAYRWQDDVSAHEYRTLSPEEVERLGESDLTRLSPLEKYDIYKGRLDFPSVRWERSVTSPNSPEWAGLCDALALLSAMLAEPGRASVKGAGGRTILFGSSDVKALMAYYYGRFAPYEPKPVGRRCEGADADPNDIACRDINPGSFHLIMARRLGVEKRDLIVDVETNRVVFNYPMYSYNTYVGRAVPLPQGAAPGAKSAVEINTVLTYAGLHMPSLDRTPLAQSLNYLNLDYILELDAQGRIVGGEWISEFHPDYVWTAELAPMKDYYADVEKIYRASVQN